MHGVLIDPSQPPPKYPRQGPLLPETRPCRRAAALSLAQITIVLSATPCDAFVHEAAGGQVEVGDGSRRLAPL